MTLQQRVTEAFRRLFQADPTYVVRAPGRVNLIGEHTDYNDGFVLPLAIDRAVWIALRPRADRRVLLASLDFGDSAEFHLDTIDHADGWHDYVRGVAVILQQRGYPLTGWEGVMAGDVPIGSGLSSSAALELAVARAFHAVSGFPWEPSAVALAAQAVETEWLGVKIGIMDQLISATGQAGHATLIDCRSLALRAVPLPAGAAVVILDTGTRRGLVGSAYNERRAQCEAAAAHFGVSHLRDVDLATFAARAAELDDTTRRRARHVISENARVLAAVRAMEAADPVTLGALMDAGHASLQRDFAVSSPALDAMVAAAQSHAGCFGARMTGAGFGGCAVALVAEAAVATFCADVSAAYAAATGHTPAVYVCHAADGAAADGAATVSTAPAD